MEIFEANSELNAFAHAYLSQRMDFLFQHVAQVAVSAKAFAPLPHTSGTAALVRTAERHLLVTCRHVYEAAMEALRDQEEGARWLLYGNGGPFPPLDITNWPLIDNGGRQLDLVTLACESPCELRVRNKQFWIKPSVRARAGVLAVAFGFPTERRFKDTNGLRTRLRKIGGEVTSVSDERILVVDQEGARVHLRAPDSSGLSENLDHGGMSGGAVFLFDNKYLHPELGGFLYETTSGARAHILAAHADFILPDGRFDHGRISW
ncbi:MAG TPA: hypothetical protein VHE55_08870 [Fimbriimonadaceae bacterium]|nr:hypothetical protein [Fimbriimonadaceae bacterium]